MQPQPLTQQFTEEIGQKFDRPLEINAGRVYDKIVIRDKNGRGGSVHAFVQRTTGDLIKAASFKAPQKTAAGGLAVRFHLAEPEGMAEAIRLADPYGSYLYAS
ncbi:MAG: DUF7717 family protein [Arachnia sp.]